MTSTTFPAAAKPQKVDTMSKPKPRIVYRDSVDGQFVTEREAQRPPRETEREVIKPPKK